MKWLSVLYGVLGIGIFITLIFFPDLIVVSDNKALNIMLGVLLSLHFFNASKLESIVADLKGKP